MGGPRGNYGNSEKAHVESKEQQQTHWNRLVDTKTRLMVARGRRDGERGEKGERIKNYL